MYSYITKIDLLSRPVRIFFGISAILSVTVLLVVYVTVDFNITGHFEGLFLVREKRTGTYEITDHLYVGEGENLIYGSSLESGFSRFVSLFLPEHQQKSSHLHLDWNPRDGSGFVRNFFPDGSSLVTYFGRYLDEDKEVHGLFVGGGMPDTVARNLDYNMNNSGMTYYNGKAWHHIWCSVNEAIDFAEPGPALTASKWKFLGSRVVERNERKVIIESRHQADQGSSQVSIDRRATFIAGEPYFSMEIRINNTGNETVYYHYTYGDEPWVGYYGTSLGDVGWVNGRIITDEETIDSSRYTYAGMADLGNRTIGERPIYTNLANFIEWAGEDRPRVYFSNDTEPPELHSVKAPLESNERFIGLQWDKALPPGTAQIIRLNIGMASFNAKTGIPEKPPTTWK
jgi:hypothetical protein